MIASTTPLVEQLSPCCRKKGIAMPSICLKQSQTLIKQKISSQRCTNEMLSQLGMMYAAGGEFTENIDWAGGAGTAEFVYHAIRYYCDTWAEKQPSFCFHRAVSVETLPGCCLRVVFRDGVVKTYAMKRLFDHLPQLKALEDPLLFAAAQVGPGGYGIIWNEDLDLDCNEIYVNGEDAV